jgi:RND family efflux transporter MFP subunit
MRHLQVFFIVMLAMPVAALGAEPVSVRPFSELAIYLERQAGARVESLNEAVLSAELSARVVEIPVRVGQSVERGEVLLRLDADSFLIQRETARARLQLAEAGLEMARLRAERARRLAPDRFVSEDQLLEAETRLRQASAEKAIAEQELATAELMLSRTEVLSPYDAVVTARLIGLGALASPGASLIQVVALEPLEIVAGISTEQAEALQQAEAPIFVSHDREWPIRLDRLAPVISPGSRTREARFSFVDAAAPAGSEGRIRWTDPRPALPADFIVQRNGRLGVLVLEAEDVVGFIELPQADAGRPHAVDLPPDLQLIDEGRRRVQPGDPVRLR